MIDPEDVAHQIELLNRQIEELYCSPICNEQGEIVSYQDWLDQDWLNNY